VLLVGSILLVAGGGSAIAEQRGRAAEILQRVLAFLAPSAALELSAPMEVPSGEPFEVTVSVTNTGRLPWAFRVTTSADESFAMSGAPVDQVVPLRPGGTWTSTWTATIVDGVGGFLYAEVTGAFGRIALAADSTKVLALRDETITATATLTATPEFVSLGQPFDLTLLIENTGRVDAKFDVELVLPGSYRIRGGEPTEVSLDIRAGSKGGFRWHEISSQVDTSGVFLVLVSVHGSLVTSVQIEVGDRGGK
jgi:hypothetical protein